MTWQFFNLLVPALIIFVAIIGANFYRYREKKEWNGGTCKQSGKPWVGFDTDSSGSRGYKDNEGNYCWVSYRVDS